MEERYPKNTYYASRITARACEVKVVRDLTADATSASQYRDRNRKSSCGIHVQRTHLVSL